MLALTLSMTFLLVMGGVPYSALKHTIVARRCLRGTPDGSNFAMLVLAYSLSL